MTVRTVRLKTVADIVVSNVDKHSIEGEAPVRLCNYVDVYKNTYIDSSLPFMESTASDEQIRRYSLRVGDVIITKDSESPSDIAVPALVTEQIPGLVCGYHLAVLRAQKDELNPRFLLRVLQSRTTASYFTTSANGITRYGLTYYSLKNAPVPVPTLPEQQQIADLLDREAAEADALVAKYERLIEILEEKRIALITQVVTKGLDTNVPMKDSGTEWIGAVPRKWDVHALKKVARLNSGYAFPSDIFSPDGIPAVQMSNLKAGILDLSDARCIPESACRDEVALAAGDLLIGMSGSLGNFARVRESDLPCQLNQRVGRFKATTAILADYLELFIQTPAFAVPITLAATGTAQLNISPASIGNVQIPVPPVSEQRAIVTSVAGHELQMSQTVQAARRAVSLIREHRSALITAAVTGQIDVTKYRPKKHAMEIPA